jgi:hypothetical protein
MNQDFYAKDYELKINYLTEQFTRMWTRFNYFLGVETTLLGGTIIFSKNLTDNMNCILICLLGTAISMVWYIMGAEDRRLVQLYRRQVQKAFEKMKGRDNVLLEYDCYVGQVDNLPEAFIEGLEKPDLSGWRNEKISTTRLAALIPLTVSVVWVIVLITALLWTWEGHHCAFPAPGK